MTKEAKGISEFPPALNETFMRDGQSVASALNIPRQFVNDWLQGTRRDPLTTTAILIETLRKNGNPNADYPFLALARRLDFIAVRAPHATGDKAFTEVLREFADVMEVRAKAEADGVLTPAERRELARQLAELIERAEACRIDQLEKAAADDRISRAAVRRLA